MLALLDKLDTAAQGIGDINDSLDTFDTAVFSSEEEEVLHNHLAGHSSSMENNLSDNSNFEAGADVHVLRSV